MSRSSFGDLNCGTELLLQGLGGFDESLRADAIDVGKRTASIGGEPKGQDRADIGLARVGDNALLHHARRFKGNRIEEALLQFLDIDLVSDPVADRDP